MWEAAAVQIRATAGAAGQEGIPHGPDVIPALLTFPLWEAPCPGQSGRKAPP